MFKRNHKAKTQQSINQTNLKYELKLFLTHFINQKGRLNEMIKRESKEEDVSHTNQESRTEISLL